MTEFTTTYQRGKTLQDINIEAFLERADEFVQDHPSYTHREIAVAFALLELERFVETEDKPEGEQPPDEIDA